MCVHLVIVTLGQSLHKRRLFRRASLFVLVYTHNTLSHASYTHTHTQVLICAFGADINVACGPSLSTPLHLAVLGNHPRLVR